MLGLQRANIPGLLMVKLFSKNSNLCDHNSPTSQTDRQTDRQTTCDRNTALCTKVHRAVINRTWAWLDSIFALNLCVWIHKLEISRVWHNQLTECRVCIYWLLQWIFIFMLMHTHDYSTITRYTNWLTHLPVETRHYFLYIVNLRYVSFFIKLLLYCSTVRALQYWRTV